MARNERILNASPETVWAVLANGWLYPLWVVGASRMRAVDDTWPEAGAALHHSVGSWPLLINDETTVESVSPGTTLTLTAKARPSGVARVVLRLEPLDSRTRVVIEEDAVSGPARFIPKAVRDAGIGWRNTETLRRLAYLAEGEGTPRGGALPER